MDRTCPKCGKVFPKPCVLKVHLGRKTPCEPITVPKGGAHDCKFCGRPYSSQISLARHVRSTCKAAAGGAVPSVGGEAANAGGEAVGEATGEATGEAPPVVVTAGDPRPTHVLVHMMDGYWGVFPILPAIQTMFAGTAKSIYLMPMSHHEREKLPLAAQNALAEATTAATAENDALAD